MRLKARRNRWGNPKLTSSFVIVDYYLPWIACARRAGNGRSTCLRDAVAVSFLLDFLRWRGEV